MGVTPAFAHWAIAEDAVRGEMMSRGFTLDQADAVAAVVAEQAEPALADVVLLEQIARDLSAQDPMADGEDDGWPYCRFCLQGVPIGNALMVHQDGCVWARAAAAVREA